MQYYIRGFNVRGSCLIRENHEHLYPRNIPAIASSQQNQTLRGALLYATLPLKDGFRTIAL